MRIHQTPRSSTNPGVAAKVTEQPMPLGWLDAGSWRLPSGQALAEFALRAGFLAPLLFEADRLGSQLAGGRKTGTLKHGVRLSPGKHWGRGPGE
jgi:hypothetical protein